MSHSGEMAGDLFDLIEWMTGHMHEAAKKGGTAYSGRAPRKVAAEFRNRLKSGLQCITARTINTVI